jgi:hypothetical protein
VTRDVFEWQWGRCGDGDVGGEFASGPGVEIKGLLLFAATDTCYWEVEEVAEFGIDGRE